MILRSVADQFYLVPQHEHALLAGRLASHWGNASFERPDPSDQFVEAVSMHDCGWRDHDARPTADAAGRPHDVFQTPLEIAMRAWEQTGVALADARPLVRLLVSLHVMALSARAASSGNRSRRQEFDLNCFQHAEIERQEELRRSLGLRVDMPLKLGLAVTPGVAEEDWLRRLHENLQALDRLSLTICCNAVPFRQAEGIVPRPGVRATPLRMERTGDWTVRVEPWPFDESELRLEVPGRIVPATAYLDGALADVCQATPMMTFAVLIHQ
jgi:hypothetical protein